MKPRISWLAYRYGRKEPQRQQAWLGWFDIMLALSFGFTLMLAGFSRSQVSMLGPIPDAVAPFMVVSLITAPANAHS